MAIDYARLKAWSFPDVKQSYTGKDAILYALGIGLGRDPVNADELRFLYEDGLAVLPTFAVALGYPGGWCDAVAWTEQHGRAAVAARKLERACGCGAALLGGNDQDGLVVERDRAGRGDGGFGGPAGPTKSPHPIPEQPHELECDLPTSPRAALIYRLSGDYNPLHIDPAVARVAGFSKPILHGLGTYGIAGHALLKTLCAYDPSRLERMDVRFSAVVFPGETIRTEIWRTGSGKAAFRCRVLERDALVLNNGYAEYRD